MHFLQIKFQNKQFYYFIKIFKHQFQYFLKWQKVSKNMQNCQKTFCVLKVLNFFILGVIILYII